MTNQWTLEEIEDLLSDAISDSLDMDWTPRDAAKAIMRQLKANGLRVVQPRSYADMAATHRELAAKEPIPEVAAAHIRFAEQHEARKLLAAASGIEAATAGETQSGSTEGESPTAESRDAQPSPATPRKDAP